MMEVHQLKTWPEPFRAVASGKKTFEYRQDDRGFRVGDILYLNEWDPGPGGGFSLRSVRATISYLIRGPAFGIPVGFVVMSLDGCERYGGGWSDD